MTKVTLTAAEINAFADKMIAANANAYSDEGKAILSGVGYYDIGAVTSEVYCRKVLAAVTAFDTTEAIRAHMVSEIANNVRGYKLPEACDFTGFAKAARSTSNQFGTARAAYAPKGTCKLTMKLSKAVRFIYTQEAYADHTVSYIPVDGDINEANKADCEANVNSFFKYANTHTGMAGSGCTYEASLKITEKGAFIVLFCRASISD